MRAPPFLSVVIVHWTGADRLRECLRALRRDLEGSDLRSSVETLVVDNGSGDDAAAVARAEMPDARVLPLAENQGFAAGANRGLAEAGGEWVATLNNDVQVEAGYCAALARAAQELPADCGMLQPQMLSACAEDRVDSTGVEVSWGGSIEDRDHGRSAARAREGGEVFCASAGAAWYRRCMLEEVCSDGRVFRPDYFMYFEDVDLGWRCRLAGWSARYVPEAVVRHARHGSASGQPRDFVKRQCARNRIRAVLANGSWPFVAGAVPRLARDAGWLLKDDPQRGLADLGRGLMAGLAARRALPARSRKARARVESAWFAPR